MSQENMEVALEIMDGLGQRNAEKLIALADPEVEWHSFFAIGESGAYRGYDGTRRYMRDLGEAFDIGVVEGDDALRIGDVIVLVGRIRYRGHTSGVESDAPAGWMLKFRRDKLLRFRAFHDPEQALEAVGLSE